MDAHRIGVEIKYKENKLLQVKELIQFELAKIGYHMLSQDLPSKILESPNTDHNLCNLKKVHGYNTRQKSLQNLSKVKNTKYYNSFLCQAIKSVQPLLFITKSADTVQTFARRYKTHLFATGDNTRK